MKTKPEILHKLNRLSSIDTFLEVLLNLCSKNLNSYVDELSTRNHRSLLNVNELNLLFGFWLKNRDKNSSATFSIDELSDMIHKLMDEFHFTFLTNVTNFENLTYEEVMLTANTLQETIFYSGTGAYDYQYVKYAAKEYELDRDWLVANKDFDINNILPFYQFFKGILNYKINFTNQSQDPFQLYKYSKNSYIFDKYPEFRKIFSAFSIKKHEILNQEFADIGDLNELGTRPVLEYENHYLIPIPFLLAQALNKSPYYWLSKDEEYKIKASSNRGICAEDIVYNQLKNKYDTCILKNVFVKPNKTKTITDLDVCIIHEEILIIFQVKSKKLTQLSKQGNLEQIKLDFKIAVTDAYEQAFNAIDPIINNTSKFYNKENKVIADTSTITEIYTVCVLLDDYPPLTSHTLIFNEKKEITPVAISIFDLEVCLEYLPKLESFIDYIKKRTENSKYIRAESELSYLQYYLKHKFEPKDSADGIILDNSLGQQFDQKYYMKLIKENERNLPDFFLGIKAEDYCFCGSGNLFKDCCIKIITGYNNTYNL